MLCSQGVGVQGYQPVALWASHSCAIVARRTTAEGGASGCIDQAPWKKNAKWIIFVSFYHAHNLIITHVTLRAVKASIPFSFPFLPSPPLTFPSLPFASLSSTHPPVPSLPFPPPFLPFPSPPRHQGPQESAPSLPFPYHPLPPLPSPSRPSFPLPSLTFYASILLFYQQNSV